MSLGEKVVELRENGLSLTEICEELNVGKSTAYYHIKKNFGKTYKEVSINKCEELIGEFLGVFAGDGSYHKSCGGHRIRLYFSGDENKYVESLKEILSDLFNKDPNIFKYNKANLIEVRYVSKRIRNFISEYLEWQDEKTYSVRLKELDHQECFIKSFLRGYLDSDGYCYKDYPKASFFGTSKDMINQISELIERLDFDPTFYNYKDNREGHNTMNFVYLTKDEAREFLRKIEPRNPKRIKDWWAGGDLNSGVQRTSPV